MEVNINRGKYERNASAAAGDYGERAERAGSKWEESASAAADLQAQAIQEAIAEGRYEKGIARAGAAKYQKGIKEKGRNRYAQGVRISGEEWERGYSPFKSTLEGMTLPPRGPKGQNYGRVEAVGEALRATKKSL